MHPKVINFSSLQLKNLMRSLSPLTISLCDVDKRGNAKNKAIPFKFMLLHKKIWRGIRRLAFKLKFLKLSWTLKW